VSWQIAVNVVGGEAKVVGQSGTLPDETAILVSGHDGATDTNLSVSLTDESGQRASSGSYSRKAGA
jgi:hypothetical protein